MNPGALALLKRLVAEEVGKNQAAMTASVAAVAADVQKVSQESQAAVAACRDEVAQLSAKLDAPLDEKLAASNAALLESIRTMMSSGQQAPAAPVTGAAASEPGGQAARPARPTPASGPY